ncbi:hypothetical protein [Pseudomonas oryzihabitans]|uniref:Uncharacterized protein n=1 Tax=Pseudomonas oryzihabitans TaxID=47885 RepID=A0AAJ2BM76_9PSED|nr:hypothetical protein [Pseudomonas psychrotolerans]MDR6236628.1 hypothetical protein [Pseudomonas psychrotolerans]MDR6353972.1 hypothetical protein [Pseudomonas psychrotolerans]
MKNKPVEISAEGPQLLELYKPEMGALDTKWVHFDFQFSTWVDDHRHWIAPSNLIVYNDGSWFAFATHLAQMRRNNNIGVDIGFGCKFEVDVQFRNAQGAIIYARTYNLASLHYKDSADNASQQGTDSSYAAVSGQIATGSATRWFREY